MNHSRSFLFRAVFILFLFTTATRFYVVDVFAAGYKIPEQSLSSVGLSGANVANASGPDSAYYNPAAMVWSDDGAAIEGTLNYIYLPDVEFSGTLGGAPANADSASENFLIPTIHYISPKIGQMRFGLSLVTPFGLSKRWSGPFQKAKAEEFTLKVTELDASVAYEVNKKVAVGGGIRGIYSDGKVKSDTTVIPTPVGRLTRDMEGDDLSFGYYASLALKPVKDVAVALTYRSEVNPTLEGNAKLSSSVGAPYDGSTSLDIVLPATFQIATAYTHNDKATIEFVYERTYWSGYQDLNFNYGGTLDPTLAAFDAPIQKNYKDSDTYRLGLTYYCNPSLILLFGFAIDETPVPEKTLGFELPDADALIYSTGFRYQHRDNLSLGLAFLTSQKKNRTVNNNDNGISGEFQSSVYMLNASVVYAF